MAAEYQGEGKAGRGKVLCVVGTRPEAIKMAPVILALKRLPELEIRVLATAQHREMLDEVFSLFGIEADFDLDAMRSGQTLAELTGRLLAGIDGLLAQESPNIVVAQGDTTTVFVSALASFYRRIPFAHVEAGLRTGDYSNPFPEEMNRNFAARVASLHFAPTETARANLAREGVTEGMIYVTGNTVIDAVRWMADCKSTHDLPLDRQSRVVLLTCHRRESFGGALNEILDAVRTLARIYPDVQFVYPVHPNPSVSNPAQQMLSGIPNILLIPPLNYARMVAVMKACYFVMTDSGGLQEEAPALGKPVLVLRNETERPEAVALGMVALVGHDKEVIISEASRLLDDSEYYQAKAQAISPYGDGHSGARIAKVLDTWFARQKKLRPN